MKKILIYVKKMRFEKKVTLLLFVLALCCLSYYIFFKIKNQLNSDVAGEILLGKEILVEHSIFPTDWFYSTEIRILNIQLLMAPIIYVTHNLIVSKSIANFIAIIILSISYLYLMKMLEIRKFIGILTLTMLLSPMSNDLMYYLYSGSFYISYVIFIILTLIIRGSLRNNACTGKKKIILSTVVIILAFSLGAQGTRLLVNLYIPLFLTDILLNWIEYRKLELKNKLLLNELTSSFLMLVAAFTGFAFNHLLSNVFHYSDTGIQSFSSINDFGNRFMLSIATIFNLFGGFGNGSLLSIHGLIAVLNLIFSMILIFIAIFLLKHFNELNKTQQATVLFFWISIAMTLYFSIFTNIEIMNKYFLNNCVLLYPLLGIFLHKIGDQLVKAEKNLIFIFMILIIIVSQYNVVFKGFIENNQNMKEIAIVKYLQKNHYYFGYATFWNANNLSVLSNGKIEIANFDSALDGRPYLWLTPSRYYSNGYYQGKTFLLLTKDEYSATSKNVIKGENKIIDKYGYIIIEYNKNKFNQ